MTGASASVPAAFPIRAVLCDLDGVVRHWDKDVTLGIETALGLPPGTIHDVALAGPLLTAACLGQLSDEQWRRAVGETLAQRHGPLVAAEAVRRWAASYGRVDPQMVALLADIRRHLPVCLVSNATTRLERDLGLLGLDGAFDAVVNSSRVGLLKPDAPIYRLAASRVGFAPDRCLFIDDTMSNVEGATTVGMTAIHFTGVPELRRTLGLLGVVHDSRGPA